MGIGTGESRPTIWTGVALLLAGCGTVGLNQGAGDSAVPARDTSENLPIRIDSLSPAWAPLAGGTEVTVSGHGFEGEVAFWFGGSEVALTLLDSETLVVLSPEVFGEAWVDVTVESDLGSFALEDGFLFTDTEPEETGEDTGEEGGEEGGGGPTGLNGGMVEFNYIVIGCPSCFGYTDNLSVAATGVFHSGVSGTWTDWIPANGSCVVDPDRSGPTGTFDDVGEHVYLESGASVSLDLQRTQQDGVTTYLTQGLGQDDYVKNASYDLVGADSGGTVSGLLRTTSGLDTLTPSDILSDSPQAFPNFSASNAHFTWSPTGVSDSYIVNIQIYSSSGAAVLGDVVCAGDDSGSLTVPSSYLAAYPVGSLLAIYFYRWNTDEEVDSGSGHTIQGVSAFGGLGTGTLRP